MYPRKKTGTRKVANQNAFVRTRSRYSRRMTAKTFFQLIVSSLDRPGFFDSGGSHGVEVDLLELRLLRREPEQVETVEGAPEELALLGPGGETNQVASVDGLRRSHSGQRRDLLGTRVARQLEQVP